MVIQFKNIKVFLVFGAIALSLCVAPNLANAAITDFSGADSTVPCANTTDSGYDFQLYPKGDTGGTRFRRKDNSSSLYVNITSRDGVHRMFVDGALDETGYKFNDCTATTYRSRKLGQYRMRNFVYERGYGFARLTSWAEKEDGFVKGKWSPDCAGSYPEMSD